MGLEKYHEGIFKVSLSNPIYRQDIYEEQENEFEKKGKVVFISFENSIKKKELEEIHKAFNKFGQTQKFYKRKNSKTIFCEYVEQVYYINSY